MNEENADEAGFVSPQYFRRLAASRAASQQSSYPPSPTRALVDSQDLSNDASEGALGSFQHHSGPPHRKKARISASSFSQGYFKQFFTDEGELGRGGKGVVILAKHWLDGVLLGLFACKRIPIGDDHEWLENVLVEVSLLQNISHQNLVSYRHVWLENYQPSEILPRSPHMFILQQYCVSLSPLQTPSKLLDIEY